MRFSKYELRTPRDDDPIGRRPNGVKFCPIAGFSGRLSPAEVPLAGDVPRDWSGVREVAYAGGGVFSYELLLLKYELSLLPIPRLELPGLHLDTE